MSDNEAPGAAATKDPAHDSSPRAQPNAAGRRLMISGAVILFLAPLAGFLGGTMVGSPGAIGGLDPLFLWLFVGMVVGSIGGSIALVGALRWVRVNRRAG